MRVIAVTSVAQSMSDEPDPAVGSRLMDEADLTIDLCTPHADAMYTIDGLDTPVGPGSTVAAVAIVNSVKVRTAQLLVERGAMPLVMTGRRWWVPTARHSCSTAPIATTHVESLAPSLGRGDDRGQHAGRWKELIGSVGSP